MPTTHEERLDFALIDALAEARGPRGQRSGLMLPTGHGRLVTRKSADGFGDLPGRRCRWSMVRGAIEGWISEVLRAEDEQLTILRGVDRHVQQLIDGPLRTAPIPRALLASIWR